MNTMEDEVFDDEYAKDHKQSTQTFNPNFYNPFEIKHRRRTSRGQFKILEKAFIDNPKPTAKFRLELASSLSMTPRGVQVWFQNRRAKAKQQQQQQQHTMKDSQIKHDDDNENVVDSLKVEFSSAELKSSGMVHSRSQSSLSSSTTYSTGNNDSLHVIQTNIIPQVIQQSPSLLTPPQNQLTQHNQHHHQNEWWSSIVVDDSHQTLNPAADVSYPFTATSSANTSSTSNYNNHTSADHLDAWAYIDSLELMNAHNKINVEDWISSTKEAQNNEVFDIIDSRRHSFPPITTHVIQQQQHLPQNYNWATQQVTMMRRLSEPAQFNTIGEQPYYV